MEHAWTLTATDVYLGWTENIAIRGRAHSRVVTAIEEVTDRLPYPMVGLAMIMPTSGLCRPGIENRCRERVSGLQSRHNHSVSRKAMTESGAR